MPISSKCHPSAQFSPDILQNKRPFNTPPPLTEQLNAVLDPRGAPVLERGHFGVN